MDLGQIRNILIWAAIIVGIVAATFFYPHTNQSIQVLNEFLSEEDNTVMIVVLAGGTQEEQMAYIMTTYPDYTVVEKYESSDGKVWYRLKRSDK